VYFVILFAADNAQKFSGLYRKISELARESCALPVKAEVRAALHFTGEILMVVASSEGLLEGNSTFRPSPVCFIARTKS
jgi:hypothetical protein